MAWRKDPSLNGAKLSNARYVLDRHERQILALLQTEGRLSHAEIGRRIGLSSSAVAERIRTLEAEEVILGYQASVDPARIGLGVTAMVTMTCDGDRCRRLPGGRKVS